IVTNTDSKIPQKPLIYRQTTNLGIRGSNPSGAPFPCPSRSSWLRVTVPARRQRETRAVRGEGDGARSRRCLQTRPARRSGDIRAMTARRTAGTGILALALFAAAAGLAGCESIDASLGGG